MGNNSLEVFAKNLKWLRKYHKLSQEDLSKGTDIPRSNLSNYEYGKNEIMLSTLIKISEFFKISIDYLIGYQLDELIYKEKKYNLNKNKNISNFARNLKRLRKERKMYQVELANKTGVAKSKISLYESGDSDITLNSLLKITDFFKISVEEIASFNINHIEFSKEEANFFKKFDVNFEEIESDREFLKLLYNLKEYYNKQLERVSDLISLINIEIPNKIKEVDELINCIENRKSETKK